MSDVWREVTLEQVSDEITVGHVGPMASEYVENGVPFLRSLNVEPFRVNETDIRYITPEFHSRLRKSALSPGDVVIVRKKAAALRLIHPLDHNFYQTCRSKLGWGNRLVRSDD